MGSSSLSSPVAKKNKSRALGKNTSTAKNAKVSSRVSKRPSVKASVVGQHDDATRDIGLYGRRRRARTACERCRIKKAKCDGEFPCKRCKDDGLICNARAYKKIEHKQLPRGYAHVLENTQLALIATIHKLYNMVRNSQNWKLGEPDLNDRGLPIIHDIAVKLGCIHPSSGINLCLHYTFPEDEAGMTELAHQLEHKKTKDGDSQKYRKDTDCSTYRNDRASNTDLNHSGVKDHPEAAFGGRGNVTTLSPQSFASYEDYNFIPTDSKTSPSLTSACQPQSMPGFSTSTTPEPSSAGLGAYFAEQEALQNMSMNSQNTVDPECSTAGLDIPLRPQSDAMAGMGDPMICGDFDKESVGL